MKQVKLTNEERLILQKLTNEQINFLKSIDEKGLTTLKQIVNTLIDIEKNIFFGTEGSKLTPDGLYAKHAYARGGIARLTTLLRIIAGSEHESSLREEERKKRKEEDGAAK